MEMLFLRGNLLMKMPSSVLIVEPLRDTELQRNLYQKGYDVIWAGDGEAALEKLGRARFDAVVISADIEKVDYIELVLSVRQQAGRIPVVVTVKESKLEETKDLPRDEALELLPESSNPKSIAQTVSGMLRKK